MSPTAARAFLAAHTHPVRPLVLPEIELRLAVDAFDIFQAADNAGAVKPFWAFAWPGGQAIARYLIDNPQETAGRRVIDLGTGSGLAAIAARMVGAEHVLANDTDPLACIAAEENGRLNDCRIEATSADLLSGEVMADVVLIGEVFYEPEMAMRVTAYLEQARRRGVSVLFADRPGVKRPPLDLELVAEIEAPLTPGLEIDGMDRARLWRLMPSRAGARRQGQRATQ
jgi:predicted nicotinamide N-methyase